MVADEILKSRPFSLNHGGVLDIRDIVGIKTGVWWFLTTHYVVANAKKIMSRASFMLNFAGLTKYKFALFNHRFT